MLMDPFEGKISGRRGASVYAQSGGKTIIKTYSKPTKSDSTAAVAQRGYFGFVANEWGDLTSQQRDNWGITASTSPYQDRFGNTFYLSGFQYFVGYNSLRLRAGLSILADTFGVGGALGEFPAPETMLLKDDSTADLSYFDFGELFTPDENNYCLFLWLGPKLEAGQKYLRRGPWFPFGVIVGDSTTPPTLTAVATPIDLSIAAGFRYALKVRSIDPAGLMSKLQYFEKTVTVAP